MSDVIVEEVRRVREDLINRYGGIDGYFKHCQAQERARAAPKTTTPHTAEPKGSEDHQNRVAN